MSFVVSCGLVSFVINYRLLKCTHAKSHYQLSFWVLFTRVSELLYSSSLSGGNQVNGLPPVATLRNGHKADIIFRDISLRDEEFLESERAPPGPFWRVSIRFDSSRMLPGIRLSVLKEKSQGLQLPRGGEVPGEGCTLFAWAERSSWTSP